MSLTGKMKRKWRINGYGYYAHAGIQYPDGSIDILFSGGTHPAGTEYIIVSLDDKRPALSAFWYGTVEDASFLDKGDIFNLNDLVYIEGQFLVVRSCGL
jgi:hypothetical protein